MARHEAFLGKGDRPCRRQRWCGLGANLALATNLNSSALQIRSLPPKRYCWRGFRRPGRRRTRLSHDIFRGRAGGGENSSEDRKLVRTDSLGLIVKTPAETAEKIIQIAQGAGGFLVTSNVNGGADATSAFFSIRVPAEKFDEVRAQIRKLSLRVDSESIDAQDVTKQYVDQEARLRNLRSQEQQYLGILRRLRP